MEIVDDGGGAPGGSGGLGHGLIGMAERAELLGGRFEAGPSGKGWRLYAELLTALRRAVDGEPPFSQAVLGRLAVLASRAEHVA